jgi:hypothetical protein
MLTKKILDCLTTIKNKKTYIPMGTLYKFEEQEEGVRVQYWQPEANGGSAVPHDNVTNIFGNSLNAHPNDPDVEFILNELNVSTASAGFLEAADYEDRAATNGTDQIRICFYTCSEIAEELIDANRNTGERGAIMVNGALVGEDVTDSSGATGTEAVPPTALCAGINKVVVATSDLSAWQGYQPAASEDLSVYPNPPKFTAIKVFKCDDLSGGFVDSDGEPVEVGPKDFWDFPPRDNCGSGGGGAAAELPQTLRIDQ